MSAVDIPQTGAYGAEETMGKDKKMNSQLYVIFQDKLKSEGWKNIHHFTTASKVPYSLETTRRLFSEHDDKNIAPITIAIIAKYLGFTPQEIKGFLKEYTSDRDLWPMLGESGIFLQPDEEALLKAYRELKDADKAKGLIANQLDVVAMAVKKDVTEFTKLIRKSG